jgi:hypothetical protein
MSLTSAVLAVDTQFHAAILLLSAPSLALRTNTLYGVQIIQWYLSGTLRLSVAVLLYRNSGPQLDSCGRGAVHP